MVSFLFDQVEPLSLADVPRRVEDAVGPQHYFAIATRTSERDAFIDEPSADTQPARCRFDVKETQLCNGS